MLARMKRDAIAELFDYADWAWERIARMIDEHPEAYAAAAPGSGWPSIAACLSHVVGSYDGWLNGPWGGIGIGEMSYPGDWPKPIDDWQAMQAYRRRTRESFQLALDVPDNVLYEPNIREAGAPPESQPLSRADVLTNLVLHERGHHGDLSTLFYQHGITGFLVDYTFYRMLPGEFVPDDGEH
jgi:uncharacterized damage-inducible protein DinB